jgi:hypothetical protein
MERAPREPLWVLNGGLGVRLAILGRIFTGRSTEGPRRSMGRDGGGLLVWAQKDACFAVFRHTSIPRADAHCASAILVWRLRSLGHGSRQSAVEREQLLLAPVGQPPKARNPRKSLRQDMLHEAAQEFLVGKRPCAALAVMSVVFSSESGGTLSADSSR